MKILITGTNGFIGRNLKEYLETEPSLYELYTPKRQELNLLNTNEVENYVNLHKFDVVIHSSVTLTSIEENLKMYFNFEKNSQNFGKMVCIGSGAEFDKRHYVPKMKENYFGRYIPEKSDIYGYSKFIIAKDIIEKKKNIFNLRVFGIFGKYEDYRRRLISNNICRALCEKKVSINKNTFFDYMFVEDFCKITKMFININPKDNTYNVCTGSTVDFLTIAKIINEINGNKRDIVVEQSGINPEYSGDNSKFIKEFGEVNFTNIKNSISLLYDWYKKKSGLVFDDKIFDKWIKN